MMVMSMKGPRAFYFLSWISKLPQALNVYWVNGKLFYKPNTSKFGQILIIQ